MIDLHHKELQNFASRHESLDKMPFDFAPGDSLPNEEDFCGVVFDETSTDKLLDQSTLCFQAIRPVNSIAFPFMNTFNLSFVPKVNHHLSYICLRGKNTLEDWCTIMINDNTLNKSLSTELEGFECLIITLLIVFLPFVILRVYPWCGDVSPSMALNMVKEEAKAVFSKRGCLLTLESEDMEDEEQTFANSQHYDERKEALIGQDHVKVVVGADDGSKVVITLHEKRPVDVPWKCSNLLRILLFPMRHEGMLDWHCDSSKNDEKIKERKESGTNHVSNGASREIQLTAGNDFMDDRYDYEAMNESTPDVFCLRGLWIGDIPKSFTPLGVAFLTTFRRFFTLMFSSCNAIFLMAMIDRFVFNETVQRLMDFRNKHLVEVTNLKYWNFFNSYHWKTTQNSQREWFEGNRWDMFYLFIICFWTASAFLYSLPGLTHRFIKAIYPSQFFGFFPAVPVMQHHLFGLDRVYAGIQQRMGLPFSRDFWKRFWSQVNAKNTSGERSWGKCLKGIVSLVCIPSCFPIVAVFPPLYSWNKKFWPRQAMVFFFCGFSLLILLYLICITLDIYVRFLIFTVTSLIYHYQATLGNASVVAGCLGFFVSLIQQFKTAYLDDKLLILELLNEVHAVKIAANEEKRNKILQHNEDNPGHRILVPELVWWWQRENWPCVPRKLYVNISERVRPLTKQRAKMFFKLVVMALFVVFIITVMRVLRMNDANSAFNTVRMAVTVAMVVVPSIIARLQSSQRDALVLNQKKAMIREEINKFLSRHPMYYNYDLVQNFGWAEEEGEEKDVEEVRVHVDANGGEKFLIHGSMSNGEPHV